MRETMKAQYLSVLFACSTMIACGCDKKRIEFSDIYSPGKDFVLRTEIDETGGPAVSDVTSVWVFPSKSSESAGKLIFKGSGMYEVHADWSGQDEINLSYGRGYVSQCDPGPLNFVLVPNKTVQIVGCK
jgi:hypothetical protein